MRRRFQTRLTELLRSEQGIALPVAMLATVVALGFAAVPIVASINTQEGDSHDQGSDMALAAAETGVNLAVARQSEMKPGSTEPCVGESGGKLVLAQTGTVPEAGWCAAITMTSTSSPAPPAGTEVIYQVMPCYHQTGANSTCTQLMSCESPSKTYAETTENLVKVVSEGKATVAGRKVTQRVSVTACSKQETTKTVKEETSAPPAVFSGGQIVGIESLYIKGNSQVYRGGAGSNGLVTIVDSSKICGGLRYGPGTLAPVGRPEQVKNVKPVSEQPYSNGTGGGVCTGELPTQGTASYPLVELPSDIATNNSNWRLTGEDKSGENGCPRCNIVWNASNKILEVKYSTLTLGGTAPYYLCGLILTGGAKLLVTKGAKISFFFDSPKNCPGLNGANQLTINGGTTVEPDAGSGPGFYFVGSPTGGTASKIYFGNGAASAHMVIYAPQSSVEIAGGINLSGAMLGRTMRLEGGANVNKLAPFTPPPSTEFLPTTTTKTETTTTTPKSFARQSYVQCSSSAVSTSPASGC